MSRFGTLTRLLEQAGALTADSARTGLRHRSAPPMVRLLRARAAAMLVCIGLCASGVRSQESAGGDALRAFFSMQGFAESAVDRPSPATPVHGDPITGPGSAATWSPAPDGSSRRWYGRSQGEQFGTALAVLRDLDGDLAAELAIGAPRAGSRGFGPGRVEVRSGRSGTLLWDRPGDQVGDRFGEVIRRAGDTNGDGLEDLLVGAPGSDQEGDDCGAVTLLSGADGEVLHQWFGQRREHRFGAALCGLDDVDGDGCDDVAVSAPGDARVDVYSGRSGKRLRQIRWPDQESGFGHGLAGPIDLDHDGHVEVLISAPGLDHDRGALLLADPATGRKRVLARGERSGSRLGLSLAALADPDGDTSVAISRGDGQVFVWSPQKLARAPGDEKRVSSRQVTSSRGAAMTTLATGGDVDGDGLPDLLTGTPGEGASLLGGGDGAQLLVETDEAGLTGLGRAMAVGDLDGDGFAEVALGQPYENGAGPAHGAVLLRDLDREGQVPRMHRIGTPCDRSLARFPRIRVRGEPRLGTEISFALHAAPPKASATLLIGRAERRQLAQFGLGSCLLHTSGRALSVALETDRSGAAETVSVEIPKDRNLLGRTVVAQWIYELAGVASVSDAFHLTLGQ